MAEEHRIEQCEETLRNVHSLLYSLRTLMNGMQSRLTQDVEMTGAMTVLADKTLGVLTMAIKSAEPESSEAHGRPAPCAPAPKKKNDL